jgi:uncharacterized YccA/Bax inhibitor family protein
MAPNEETVMAIGFALFLIAIGAVLRWVIGGSVAGVSVATLGLVVMLIGVIGGLIVAIAGGTSHDSGRALSFRRRGSAR